jgi:hypothetical protein
VALVVKMRLRVFVTVLCFLGNACAHSRREFDMKGSKMNSDLLLLAKASPSLTGEFVLHCQLKNVGEKTESFFFLPFPPYIQVRLKQNGVNVDLNPAILRRVRVSKKDIISLKVGESHVFDFEITRREYVWPAAGIYEATIVYTGSGKIEGIKVWTGQIESNTFKLEFQ